MESLISVEALRTLIYIALGAASICPVVFIGLFVRDVIRGKIW